MNVGAMSDPGKVRDMNEDNYCVYDNHIQLYMVADGMGGHNGGEVASLIAINTIKEHVTTYIDHESEEASTVGILYEAFNRANQEILKRAVDDISCDGMGTTVTLGLVIGNTLYVGHIGDSRAYLIENGGVRQITQDHSLVAELVRNGSISESEAMRHPQKNVITRALGTDLNMKVDIFSLDFNGASGLILCTDGLTNFVDLHEIEEVILGSQDPQESCETLVKLANKRGGYDNITVVFAKISLIEAEGR
ncbi:Protein phosphatase 2C-like protein [Alkaliphilus metalliredigens QYMF]|uniref:Protein phosphatase 2C-like protein n=1 Tax=Alkaliphilus metalliredigens (strain QYMF) TaxID=293826 RepID=A6TRW2_ALKMQ|nr:Stp1/IreP family PP2C-type Ser/Thr phosphatase [Alkaliphilus metalliredigens]ABR48930.1 Protein phosphatase 2C-like protein [Alkaliphilus metalliredigens QYMF]